MDKAASRIRLPICGTFALQMRHYWNAKGVHLKGKRGTLAWQKG